MSSNTNSQNQQGQQPGLISGHTEYVKGVVEGVIGGVTGSEPWKHSGAQAKAHGTATMKAAAEQRNATTQGYGKIEETLGKVTGCEGMAKEGAASADKHS